MVFLDQRGQVWFLPWPPVDPLLRGHQADDPGRLPHKRSKIGRGISKPRHRHSGDVRPHTAYLMPDQAPGNPTEGAGVKPSEINNIWVHRSKTT